MATVRKSALLAVTQFSTQTVSFDVGTNPQLLVVMAGLDNQDNAFAFISCTINGVALPGRVTRSAMGRKVYLFDKINPAAMSGSVTFAFTTTGFLNGQAMAFAVEAGGPTTFITTANGASASGNPALTLNAGTELGLGFVVASLGGGRTPTAKTTEDNDSANVAMGHQTVPETGSASLGWTDGPVPWAAVAAMYGLTTPNVAPDPVGLVIGLNAGSLDFEGVVVVPATRVRGIELGLRAGSISFTATRHVALVGAGLATSQMTDGRRSDGAASELGDVLTWHPGDVPSFDEPSGGGGGGGGDVAAHEAASDPHTGYQRESEKGAASGYASLGGSTKVPLAELPTGTTSSTVAIGDHSHGGGSSSDALKVLLYERFR